MKYLLAIVLTLSLFLAHSAHASEDDDSDGVQNGNDLCADTDSDLAVDADGCGAAQLIEKAAAEALYSAVQLAISDIDALLLNPVSAKSNDKLANTKNKLTDATEKLGEPDVEKGLKKLSEAVGELMKAGDEGEAVSDIIDSLLAAVQAEVQAAIDAAGVACSNEPDPKTKEDCEDKVDDANDKVDDANLEITAKGHFHHAIEDLKNAWKKAQEAFEKSPPELPPLVMCPCTLIFDEAIESYKSNGGMFSDDWDTCAFENPADNIDLFLSMDGTTFIGGSSRNIRIFTYGPLGVNGVGALTCRAESFSSNPSDPLSVYDESELITEEEEQACIALQASICSQ